MIEIREKEKCCGCTACAAVCPVQCIEMKEDQEGFSYPEAANDRCVDCGLCEKVCPVLEKHGEVEATDVYFFQSHAEEDRRYSTSGAFFAEIGKTFLAQGDAVYAVLYDQNMEVVHQRAGSKRDLDAMRMSKYVQSRMNGILAEIKADLAMGRRVLFVGTPCQTAGVYRAAERLCKKQMDQLHLIDLECYGVPSPGLYRRWIQELEKKYGSEVASIYFRDKKYGYAGVNVKVVLKNGKILEDCVDVKTFTRTMFSGIGLRPSCYHCPFRSQKKYADLTLGDGWSVSEEFPELDDDKGTTKIYVNSEKGRELLALADGICVKGKQRPAVPYGVDKKQHEKRPEFFAAAESMTYEELIGKFLPTTGKDRLANALKPWIRKAPFSKTFFRTLKKIKRWKRKHHR